MKNVLKLVMLFIVISIPISSYSQIPTLNLRSTENFVILAGSAITGTPSDTIIGDVGLSPIGGGFITGFDATNVTGTLYAVDASGPAGSVSNAALLSTAKSDLTLAYNDARDRIPVPTLAFLDPGGGDIGGMNLVPGLYKFTSTAAITGSNLTLTGNPTDVWIFQIGTSLNIGSYIKIILAGGAQATNIFWQVGTSATLGTYSVFKGTILADQSITIDIGAKIDGRALAFGAAVTMGTGVKIAKPILDTYTITGTITESGSNLSGVSVSCPGANTATPIITDATGTYSFTVNAGGNYTVTPSKTNYTFTPISQTFNNVTSNQIQNFTATLNTYTITGTITSGGVNLSGVSVSCPGANTSTPITTDATGTYTFTVNAGGNYTITPTKTNYTFTPTSQTFNNVTSNQTQNFTTTLNTFTITGTITSGGSNLSGVSVSCPGANTATPIITDATGTYSFTVNAGGNYTVTPSKTNYTFTPTSQTFNNVTSNQTQNFTATLNTYTITGTITFGGVNLSGVSVSCPGANTATPIITDATGTYSFTVNAGGNYTVTPSKTNYTFTPISQTFNNVTSNQTQNFTATLNTFTITGTITAGGSNLSGVSVSCPGANTATPIITDATGTYSFTVNAGGNYTVTPTKTNYTFTPISQTFNNVTSNQTQNFTATLNTFTITGTITAGGSNLSGVSVSCPGANTSTPITTDATGTYSFTVNAGGSYTVTLTKTNYTFTPISQTFNNVTSNQTQNFTATLNTYTITGTITESGSNISGVSVSCPGANTATPIITDATGTYSFTVNAGGNYTVTPSKTNYTFTPTSQAFNNVTSNQTQNFTATLNTYTITGTITESGSNLSGVSVSCPGANTATPIITDATGTYSFTVNAGGNYTVTPTKTNYTFTPTNQTFNNVMSNQTQNFTATLNTYTITGTITFGGVNLSGVTVSCPGANTATPIITDATGTYSFTVNAGGNYTVTPTKTNYTFTPTNQTFNNVTSNQTQNFTATLNTYTITGTITFDGVNLSGVSVSCPGANTATPIITDATGTYSFTVNAGGNYTVTPSKTNYTFTPTSQTFNNVTSNQTQNFTATLDTFTITGTITAGGSNLSGVSVSCPGANTATPIITDATGTYSFTVNAGGNYTVTPSKTNYTFTPVSQTYNNVTSNQIQNFTATLNTFTISGTITGASFVTVGLSGSSTASTLTDGSGNYIFTINAGGSYTITPTKTNYTVTPTSQTFNNVTSNQTQNFTATLNTYTITGTITSGGSNLSGVSVSCPGANTATPIITDATGTYSFTVNAGGNYTVTPTKTNYIFVPISKAFINVTSNKTQNFVGTFNANTYTISGNITGATNVNVELTGSGEGTVITDGSGNYSFPSVGNGSYTVTPTKDSYTFLPINRSVTVNGADQINQNFAGSFAAYGISGYIRNPNNTGLSNTKVYLSVGRTDSVTTDTSGFYTFLNLPANANYTITPSKTDYSFVPINQQFINLSENKTNINFTGNLSSLRYSISGRVKESNENGIQGVQVTISGDRSDIFISDGTGSYTFTNLLPGGNYTITPSKTNYTFLPLIQQFNTLDGNKTNTDFVGIITNFPYAISGRVQDNNGNGLIGVRVKISGNRTDSIVTDISGTYTFMNLVAGGNYTITPSKTNYTFLPINQAFIGLNGNKAGVNFTGQYQTLSITGTVKDGNGLGISGTKVKLSVGKSDSVITDITGNYSFTGLVGGLAYTVTPTKTNYTFSPISQIFTNVTSNQTQNFIGTYAGSTYTISGSILGATNVPVTLSGSGIGATITDSSGYYSFPSIVNGSYTVTPLKAGYVFVPTNRSVTVNGADQTSINFTCTNVTYSISGYVRDINNNGLPNAKLTLSDGKNDSTTTNANGFYSFSNIPASANYTITPSKINNSFVPTSHQFISLSENKTNIDFIATLSTVYVISGFVKDTADTPLLNAKMYLSVGKSDSTIVDRFGLYSFVGLSNRINYTVTPSMPYYTFTPTSIAFAFLTEYKVNVNFIGKLVTFSIAGLVKDGSGNPISGVKIKISQGKTDSVTTDVNGAFSFSALFATQNYVLTPSKVNYSFSPISYTVSNLISNVSGILFTSSLLPTYGISGFVKDVAGSSMVGVKVGLSGGKTDSTTTDINGAYLFGSLTSNLTYKLLPSKTNFNFSPTDTSVFLTENKPNINFKALINYSISGKIKDISGNGLQGTKVKVSGSNSDSVTTDISGTYTFTNLVNGGNFTIIPTKANYSFVPIYQQFNSLSGNKTNIDFVGTLTPYGIFGFVLDVMGNGMVGVKVKISDGRTDSMNTDNNGMFVFTNNTAGGNYTVTPYKATYTFNPPFKSFTNLSTIQSVTFYAVNKLPTPFSLISPANNEIINFVYPPKPIIFKWQKSTDPDGYPIIYTLNIFPIGSGYSKSYPNLTDTVYSANCMECLAPSSSYTWYVVASDGSGETKSNTFTFKTSVNLTNVEKIDGSIPNEFALKQNYPNPFNPSTSIEFAIPKSCYVTLKIYSVIGKEIATLVSNNLNSGYYKATWDASNVPTGLYYYKLVVSGSNPLQTDKYNELKKMVYIK